MLPVDRFPPEEHSQPARSIRCKMSRKLQKGVQGAARDKQEFARFCLAFGEAIQVAHRLRLTARPVGFGLADGTH